MQFNAKLTREDLWSLEDYSEERAAFRARVIAHKKPRQVALGPHATLYFEDALTMKYQVQEMLRVEKIFNRAEIEEELAAYNPLIPDGSNWKATFMIEYADVAERRAALARMAGRTYAASALSKMTAIAVDQGEKPSVPGAISKYHVTEMGPQIAMDAMDIHGGKGIMMGPNNYLANAYCSVPVGITVEGANILTRCLIIFGQGAIRCHPYIFQHIETLQKGNIPSFLFSVEALTLCHYSPNKDNPNGWLKRSTFLDRKPNPCLF